MKHTLKKDLFPQWFELLPVRDAPKDLQDKFHEDYKEQEIDIKNLSKEECTSLIKEMRWHKDYLLGIIEDVARAHIKDYHFLDYKVSDFWTYEKSPIGMCVFKLHEGRFDLNCTCRYCGDPVERK